jgi:hypothetical protein
LLQWFEGLKHKNQVRFFFFFFFFFCVGRRLVESGQWRCASRAGYT